MLNRIKELIDATSQVESLTAQSIISTMMVALLCGAVIYIVYRVFNRGMLYSENFNVLNILVCMITAFIIITIGANLVLSLGMVGALSIVRFRAAVKDPLDVGFIYWSVAVGLTAGARLYLVALLGTAAVALVYVLLFFLRKDKHSYLLILRFRTADDAQVSELIKQNNPRNRLKNRQQTSENVELTLEVKLPKSGADVLNRYTASSAISNATLVEYTQSYQ